MNSFTAGFLSLCSFTSSIAQVISSSLACSCLYTSYSSVFSEHGSLDNTSVHLTTSGCVVRDGSLICSDVDSGCSVLSPSL